VQQELLEAAHRKSEATRGKLFSTKVHTLLTFLSQHSFDAHASLFIQNLKANITLLNLLSLLSLLTLLILVAIMTLLTLTDPN
jgi:hypothetical protein